jgi:hypothetical protein
MSGKQFYTGIQIYLSKFEEKTNAFIASLGIRVPSSEYQLVLHPLPQTVTVENAKKCNIVSLFRLLNTHLFTLFTTDSYDVFKDTFSKTNKLLSQLNVATQHLSDSNHRMRSYSDTTKLLTEIYTILGKWPDKDLDGDTSELTWEELNRRPNPKIIITKSGLSLDTDSLIGQAQLIFYDTSGNPYSKEEVDEGVYYGTMSINEDLLVEGVGRAAPLTQAEVDYLTEVEQRAAANSGPKSDLDLFKERLRHEAKMRGGNPKRKYKKRKVSRRKTTKRRKTSKRRKTTKKRKTTKRKSMKKRKNTRRRRR